jgi:hypothetical protein
MLHPASILQVIQEVKINDEKTHHHRNLFNLRQEFKYGYTATTWLHMVMPHTET